MSQFTTDSKLSEPLKRFLNKQELADRGLENQFARKREEEYKKIIDEGDPLKLQQLASVIGVDPEADYLSALHLMQTILASDEIQNKHMVAIKLYESAPTLQEGYQSRIEAMKAYSEQGNHHSRNQIVQNLLNTHPSNGNLRHQIGMMYKSSKEPKLAMENFNAAFSEEGHYNIDAGLEILKACDANQRSFYANLLCKASQKAGACLPYQSRKSNAAEVFLEAAIRGDVSYNNDNEVLAASLSIAQNPDIKSASMVVRNLMNLNPNDSMLGHLEKSQEILNLRTSKIECDNIIQAETKKSEQAIDHSRIQEMKEKAMTLEESINHEFNSQFGEMNFGYTLRGANQEPRIITGNWSFGGPIPNTIINNKDFEHTKRILDTPISELVSNEFAQSNGITTGQSLGDIKDSEQFIEFAQQVVRKKFGTKEKNMEVIDHKDHDKYFDTLSKVYHSVCGFPDSQSKRTNDSPINFAHDNDKGQDMGDCRKHAMYMQILYDTWNEERMNTDIGLIHRGKAGDFETHDKETLAITDLSFKGNIKMHSMYRPERNTAGNLQYSPEVHAIEEHTLSMFRSGNKVRLADSFYHEQYDLKDAPVDVEIKDNNLSITGVTTSVACNGADSQIPINITNAPYKRIMHYAATSELPSLSDQQHTEKMNRIEVTNNECIGIEPNFMGNSVASNPPKFSDIVHKLTNVLRTTSNPSPNNNNSNRKTNAPLR